MWLCMGLTNEPLFGALKEAGTDGARYGQEEANEDGSEGEAEPDLLGDENEPNQEGHDEDLLRGEKRHI